MSVKIRYHWQLDVYKLSVEAAMEIFQLTKKFPREEMYSLTDQIDWDSALREQNGTVNALGLYDLDRNIRRVGQAYKQLIKDWRDVLPAQSICLVVPIVTPQQSGRIEAVQQERSAKALAARPSADPAGIEDTSK